MLTQLSIRNFALIAGADIPFSDGFTTITGETGSGKSILLGALNLILGERADYSVIRDEAQKTVVEATFRMREDFREWFEQNDIDWEPETLIRREITAQGKSRAFINDTPVQLTQLRELTEQLVYIHSQHQTLELRKPHFQLSLLDSFAGISEKVKAYQTDYRSFRKEQSRLATLEKQLAEFRQEDDYLRFQLNELENLELDKHHFATYETELARFGQLDDLRLAYDALSNGLTAESGALDALRHIRQVVDKWRHADPELEQLAERLSSVVIELDDISAEASGILDTLEIDPERQALLMQLVDKYNQLLRKHNVQTQQELESIVQELQNKFGDSLSLEEEIAALKNTLSAEAERIAVAARELHEKRSEAATRLEQHLLDLMRELKLPDAQLTFVVNQLNEPDANGISEVELLFSANAGMSPKTIDKTASGGELSRFMLAVQATLSEVKSLPTLILDEIDTGVSGEVALRIGQLLQRMGNHLQLFAITHLPQVAAKGTQQLEVAKTTTGGGTETRISVLSEEKRLEAIARLMSGEMITEAAKANARVLLG